MQSLAPLLAAVVLCLFSFGLSTRHDAVGRFARRPAGHDGRTVPRLLGGVAALLGLALVVWTLL